VDNFEHLEDVFMGNLDFTGDAKEIWGAMDARARRCSTIMCVVLETRRMYCKKFVFTNLQHHFVSVYTVFNENL
jgi:hypothetical protein